MVCELLVSIHHLPIARKAKNVTLTQEENAMPMQGCNRPLENSHGNWSSKESSPFGHGKSFFPRVVPILPLYVVPTLPRIYLNPTWKLNSGTSKDEVESSTVLVTRDTCAQLQNLKLGLVILQSFFHPYNFPIARKKKDLSPTQEEKECEQLLTGVRRGSMSLLL